MSDNGTGLQPGFIVIHGNQSETLRDLLRDWMRAYPLGPLENEVILVQSNGIAQWLSLSLAADPEPDGGGGLGIAAALDIQLPSRFIWQAYRDVLGDDQVPDRAPFGSDLVTWRLMRLLPQWLDEPDFAPLHRFLEDDPLLVRRHQLAVRLADLFDQYQVYRADWLEDWAAGRDVIRTQRGGVEPLAPEARWQARLWRELLADVGEEGARSNRAVLHQRFMAACADPNRERPAGLPRRVLVFGISTLSRQSLDVLSALGRWCQVLLCVQNPCQYFWADLVPDRELLKATRFRHGARPGTPLDGQVPGLDHGHALLAAWGRQGRDLIGLLAEHDEHLQAEAELSRISRRADVFVSHDPDTMLGQLQQDILDLRPLIETRAQWSLVDPERDRSIRFHLCHSPLREVEVLHDQLLAAFEEDPGLQPRDVMVMVPDIDAYVPLIQAVFGMHAPHGPRFIPFTLADQAARRHEPLLAAVEFLLNLPQSRVEVTKVLDLLDVPAVQRRFGIDSARLPRVRDWIHQSGIRWGLDVEQRAALDILDPVEQNSWVFGLKRMLLGYAVGNQGTWADIGPLDEIGDLDGDLLGHLVALVEALIASWRYLREPADPPTWAGQLAGLLNEFFEPTDEHEAMLLMRLNESLQQWREDCEQTHMHEALPLSVVREHWLSNLEDKGLSRRFFAGAVTFATLMPMRAIPFRQVYLLGMNEKDYPRRRQPADFDLMADDYRPGDRSRREDDRYLFLEALLSARERLSISWVGRSIHDDSPCPPSVLVAQLRDHLEAGWCLAGSGEDQTHGASDAGRLLEALSTRHRLQPFSRAYFDLGGREQGLFSHADEWRQVWQSMADGRTGRSEQGCSEPETSGHCPRLWPSLSPVVLTEPLSLSELSSFLRDPVRHFFIRRLDIGLDTADESLQDQESFRLDGLQHWQIQDELIKLQRHAIQNDQSAGKALDLGLARLAREGRLPVGGFGEVYRRAMAESMEALFESYRETCAAYPIQVPDERFEWPADESGHLPAVTGLIDQLRMAPGGRMLRLVISTSGLVEKEATSRSPAVYRHEKLPGDWVVHLALCVMGRAVTTKLLSPKGEVTLRALSREDALAAWNDLLIGWREGMCYPLPLALKTGFEWLMRKQGGNDKAPISWETAEREPWLLAALDRTAYLGWQDLEAESKSPAGAIRQRYEGSDFAPGEMGLNPYLARAYPDIESLWDGGALAGWSLLLLRPLRNSIMIRSSEKAKVGKADASVTAGAEDKAGHHPRTSKPGRRRTSSS